MADQKISQITTQLPLTTDLMVAARDNSGNPTNVTFTIADLLAAVIGSPFKVFNTDPSYTEVGANCVITDARLKNATGFPVYSTQLNCEFLAGDLTYNAVDGILTIADFHLQDGQHLSLYPTSALGNQAGANQEIIDQINTLTDTVNTLTQSLSTANDTIEELSYIAAPFKLNGADPNGGRLVWNKPANLIPSGWAPDEDFAGRMALGRTAADVALDTVGKVGGAKTHNLTKGQLPKYNIPIPGQWGGDNNDHGTQTRFAGGDKGSGESNFFFNLNVDNGGNNEAFPILNPFRIVEYIKFVGV